MTNAVLPPAGSPLGPDPGKMRANRLLAALPDAELAALHADLESVMFASGQVLYEPRWPLEHVWFPLRGVASLLTPMPGAAPVEAVAIGPEGMVGLTLALGVETATEGAVVRVPGEAARVSAEAFRRALNRGPGLRRVMARYTLALVGQMAQTGACAWVHEVEQRLANRLVITQDAVHGAATFTLTHEMAAEMLGVHRPTVSAAAAKLQRAGLIAYARGAVTVLDRPGLDAASCGCHRAVRARFDHLLNGADRGNLHPG